jgi:type I pullulanase
VVPHKTLPENWRGTVRIYYHNDLSDYGTKALWIWTTGVDGLEYIFTNRAEAASDPFGAYYDLDLTSGAFAAAESVTTLSFIVKTEGTWAGQSTDTVATLADYADTLSDDEKTLTIYAYENGDGSIATTAKKEEALGDKLLSVEMTSWTTLSVKGTGTSDGRAASEIGKVAYYELYAFTGDYYRLTDTKKELQKSQYLLLSDSPSSNDFTITLPKAALPTTTYIVEAKMSADTTKIKKKSASFVPLYDEDTFVNTYTYNGSDLGLSYDTNGVATFKLWAPTCSRVNLRLYTFGTPKALDPQAFAGDDLFASREMTFGEGGVWSYTAKSSDSSFKFYTFAVTQGGAVSEVNDPYARSSGVNGVRSAILTPSDWSSITPAGFATSIASLKTAHPISSPNQLTVYEAHVRDFTADESWISNSNYGHGTYQAFAESGTSYGNGTTTVKTGFDHLKEFGVNAVQLMPVFDQDNDERTLSTTLNGVTTETKPGYNWGYNPLNYNVVEGAYSSDPYSAKAKVTEYKGLVQSLADAGIRTIMDVVYNHVSSVSSCAFNKVMPKYYFRVTSDGAYSNGTGCGNETASERKMMRKYIVDSVSWWAKEYGIKGFRFDLMGSLDTETMKEVKAACYSIDPEIVVYGEPWAAADCALDTTKYSYARTDEVYSQLYNCGNGDVVGCFNDASYGAFVGNTEYGTNKPGYGFISKGPGYMTSDILTNSAKALIGANGTRGGNPAQSVNYVACHDNYTLYDHLNYCVGSGLASMADNETAMKAVVSSQDAVLFSQGIAFINGGDEIMRQKELKTSDPYFSKALAGDYLQLDDGNYLMRNSYAYGDAVNSFKWDRKADATINPYYKKITAAVAERSALMGSVFGKTYDQITTNSEAWTWGDLKTTSLVTAAGAKSGSTEYYVLWGGDATDEWSSVGIGNGTLEVVYSSNDALHQAGQSFTISNNLMGVGKMEMLLLKRTA